VPILPEPCPKSTEHDRSGWRGLPGSIPLFFVPQGCAISIDPLCRFRCSAALEIST